MSESGRKFWGWGVKEADPSEEQKKKKQQSVWKAFLI